MDILKNKYAKSIALLLVTVLFSVLAAVVDRQPIGVNDTVVGFATLNGAFKDIAPYNHFMDIISDVMMILSFLVVAFFAFTGAVILIRTKNIKKVGKVILGLGVLYIVVAVIYILFDKIPINYRPIIPPGKTKLQTSFPSTHTLIICSVMGSAYLAWEKVLRDKNIVKVLKIVCIVVIVVGVISRAFAGVHWLTDIIAGILFSMTLISLYSACSLNESAR